MGMKKSREPPPPREPHITFSSLVERGWTKSLVIKFLGEPDKWL